MRRKNIALLLAFSLTAGLPISPCGNIKTVNAAEDGLIYAANADGTGTTANGLSYASTDDGTGITITGYNGNEAALTIPEQIDGKTVTVIGTAAFSECSFTEVTIPAGVTSITSDAFAGCTSLTAIKTVEGNTSYKSLDGILYSKDLTELVACPGGLSGEITVPSGVGSIGMFSFYGCSSLTGINLPESVTFIGQSAFKGCSLLTKVSLPAETSFIAACTFENCSSLTEISIPIGISTIANSAFAGCSSLRDVYYSGTEDQWSTVYISNTGNTSLLSATFHYNYITPDVPNEPADGLTYEDNDEGTGITITGYNESGTNLTIPEQIDGKTVTAISSNAFSECTSLERVTLPEGITQIGAYAFDRCSSLTDVNIPSTVTSIGSGAFCSCTSLTGITIPVAATSIDWNPFEGCTSLTSIHVAEGNTAYKSSDGMLYSSDMTQLIACPGGLAGTITVPEQTVYIENSAFSGCTSLVDINLSKETIAIRSCAFDECTSLKNIVLPKNIYNIGSDTFRNCASLTEINIPEAVESIYSNPFAGCTSLTAINVDAGNTTYASSDGILYTKDLTELLICPGGLAGEITVPAEVTQIQDYAFERCTSLTKVILPEGIPQIGDGTFDGCTSLTDIDIPESVTRIGNAAFCGCTSLKSFTLPKGVTLVNMAFDNCTSLTEIMIPSGTTIGEYVFYNCISLKKVSIMEGVTSIGKSAFDECTSLTDVYFSGIKEQWDKIDIAPYNDPLFSATLHCMTPDATNPDATTPDATNPDAPTPDATDPDATTPDATNPDATNPDATNPDATTPDATNPAATNPDATNPDATNPNATSPDATSPDVTNPDTPGTGGTTENPPQKPGSVKTNQTIQVSRSITKTYGTKAFSLGARSSGGTALSYKSSNTKVAAVNAQGKVTIKGCGIAQIIITAPETTKYRKAQITVKLTVKPKKATLSSVKSKKKKTAFVKWKKDKSCTGYIIQCATNKKFTKGKIQTQITGNKKVSATVKKLKPGKKYYVRICAYAKSGNTKLQGNWSKAKTVKIKK